VVVGDAATLRAGPACLDCPKPGDAKPSRARFLFGLVSSDYHDYRVIGLFSAPVERRSLPPATVRARSAELLDQDAFAGHGVPG